MADFVDVLDVNQENKNVFKKMPSIAIPKKIKMAHNDFISRLHDKKMENLEKTPEYIDFYMFVSDISNIGLVNNNGQYGYCSELQMAEHCMDIFEYFYPENYSKESILIVLSILEEIGCKLSHSRSAIYGCEMQKREFVWVDKSILVKI